MSHPNARAIKPHRGWRLDHGFLVTNAPVVAAHGIFSATVVAAQAVAAVAQLSPDLVSLNEVPHMTLVEDAIGTLGARKANVTERHIGSYWVYPGTSG